MELETKVGRGSIGRLPEGNLTIPVTYAELVPLLREDDPVDLSVNPRRSNRRHLKSVELNFGKFKRKFK